MTRIDQLRAAVLQSLDEGPCSFDTLLQRVRRAFPDAEATEVDQAAREWERGTVGRCVYSLEPLPATGQLGLFREAS